MGHRGTGKLQFCQSVIGLLCAGGGLALFGCGGSTHASGSESAAGSAAVATAGSSAAFPTPNAQSGGANGGAGSTNPAPAGSAGSAGTPEVSAAGTGQGGSAGMADGIDFSHGSRLLIPQRQITNVHLGPTGDFNTLTSLDNIDVTTATEFIDAPIYPRQFEVNFTMSGLFIQGCQVWSGGVYEIASLEVKQDVTGKGGQLKIEQADGHYLLTHDGPGTHQIRVTGTFRVDHTAESGGVCSALPMGPVEVPIAFTTNINIQRMGSVTAMAPIGCAPGSAMLSGRNYRGTRISVLNEYGQPVPADNVYDSNPLDVIVETEKPAQIAEGGSGLYYDGLIVTGEPQTVRLSTSYGTLFTYQLANTAMIDGWDVKFWSRATQYIKSPSYPLAMDSTPAVASGRVLGATATLSIGGVKLCAPILASDFKTSLLSPTVCNVQSENSPDPSPGIPGFLATFVDPAKTCELELSVPGANGEKGLVSHLSSLLVVPPAQ